MTWANVAGPCRQLFARIVAATGRATWHPFRSWSPRAEVVRAPESAEIVFSVR